MERYKAHFEHWGVSYEVATPAATSQGRMAKSEAKIQVKSLPPSIAERCRQDPRLLADLVRKEIWQLEESGRPAVVTPRGGDIDNGGHSWVSRFHGCPQGILDMINSRACRSECFHSNAERPND